MGHPISFESIFPTAPAVSKSCSRHSRFATCWTAIVRLEPTWSSNEDIVETGCLSHDKSHGDPLRPRCYIRSCFDWPRSQDRRAEPGTISPEGPDPTPPLPQPNTDADMSARPEKRPHEERNADQRASARGCRIAIIEDGVLEELYVERTSYESYTGNIYKGRIVNLDIADSAAFVDCRGRNGFARFGRRAQYLNESSTKRTRRLGGGGGTPAGTRAGPRAERDQVPKPGPRRPPRLPRRGLSRFPPPGCRRPRPGLKSGLESEVGNAIETRTEAVSVSARLLAERSGAIDPTQPRHFGEGPA